MIEHLRRAAELVSLCSAWELGAEVSGEKTKRKPKKEFAPKRMCFKGQPTIGRTEHFEEQERGFLHRSVPIVPPSTISVAAEVSFDAFGDSHVLCHTSASVGTLAASSDSREPKTKRLCRLCISLPQCEIFGAPESSKCSIKNDKVIIFDGFSIDFITLNSVVVMFFVMDALSRWGDEHGAAVLPGILGFAVLHGFKIGL